MPYTCVRGVSLRLCRGGGVTGMLSWCVVSRRWRHGVRSRVACARRRPQRRDGGSTRGTRGGGQRAGAVGVRARGAAQRCLRYRRSAPSRVASPRVAPQGAKTTWAKFVAHFAFGRSFSSRCSKAFKLSARAKRPDAAAR